MFLSGILSPLTLAFINSIAVACIWVVRSTSDDSEGYQLSLAYHAKIVLNTVILRLKRGEPNSRDPPSPHLYRFLPRLTPSKTTQKTPLISSQSTHATHSIDGHLRVLHLSYIVITC
ncbi:hypothetical protein BDQ17DRAFT_308238 [Cyathus striatus]|nr:hypothetical protein BDQ17DRAFT_308238 [Cyathus striatus]